MHSGVHFVYRSPYEGPTGKRVVKLQAASILEWFHRGWDAATDTEIDLFDWVETECQGSVYGLDSIFNRARAKGLPKPNTWQELHGLLRKHLYVEGGSDYIQQDEFSLRVRTDDDENDLAYYFIEEGYAAAHPEVVSYLLLDTADLGAFPPEEAQSFPVPGPFNVIAPPGSGEGVLYICFMVRFDSGLLDLTGPYQIQGVRLPGFSHYLRTATPGQTAKQKDVLSKWPWELRYLRAFTGETDETPREALRLCGSVFKENFYEAKGLGSIPEARAAIEKEISASKRANQSSYSTQPAEPFVSSNAHFAQLCGTEGATGNPEAIRAFAAKGVALPSFLADDQFVQWFLFDDLWVSEHPHLATSLFRTCSSWDPFPNKSS